MKLYTDRILKRLQQFTNYLYNANEHTYWHRLREFKHFCENTPSLAYSLAQLPKVPYDWNKQWRLVEWPLDDAAACAFRWDAIQQLVSCTSRIEFNNLLWRIQSDSGALRIFAQEFVVPLSEYLAHQLESPGTMLYILLRYKRWAEWFEAEQLRWIYSDDGEDGLDRDLRRFLFESGIDYPYSQPQSPGGRADIVAGLETDDPLVLEVKVWDSNKGYKEDRCRDGLR